MMFTPYCLVIRVYTNDDLPPGDNVTGPGLLLQPVVPGLNLPASQVLHYGHSSSFPLVRPLQPELSWVCTPREVKCRPGLHTHARPPAPPVRRKLCKIFLPGQAYSSWCRLVFCGARGPSCCSWRPYPLVKNALLTVPSKSRVCFMTE